MVDTSEFKPKFESLHDYELYEDLTANNTPINPIEKKFKNKYRRELQEIWDKYNDLFFIPGDKLNCTGTETLRVPLQPGMQPINRKQYRLPEAHRAEAQKQIKTMLEDGIIEPNTSPFNFPVILVPKKGTNLKATKNIDYVWISGC